jgi:hypothetical protein
MRADPVSLGEAPRKAHTVDKERVNEALDRLSIPALRRFWIAVLGKHCFIASPPGALDV